MNKHAALPTEAASPVVGEVEVPRGDDVAPVTFIGGTGRSGTHVLAQLLSRNERMALVPVEVRFHTDPGRLPRAAHRRGRPGAVHAPAARASGGRGAR